MKESHTENPTAMALTRFVALNEMPLNERQGSKSSVHTVIEQAPGDIVPV